jgi:hypothetical protein
MTTTKQVRRSVTLPARRAEPVERIAKKRQLSDNRVLVEMVKQGLEAQKEAAGKREDIFRSCGTLPGGGRSETSKGTRGMS